MRKFEKFTGNYQEVCKKLGLPRTFYKRTTQKECEEQLEKDLPRTSYLSYSHSVEQIKDKLREPIGRLRNLSYTQGDLSGAIFTSAILQRTNGYMEKRAVAGNDDGFQDSISFAYVDDDGIPCGFSIAFMRDDPDPNKVSSTSKENRERFFSVTIIKNTMAPITEREVFCFCDSHLLLDEQKKRGEVVKANHLWDEITTITHSEILNQLLRKNLFKESDKFSSLGFSRLKARLPVGANIDNRDERKIIIERYIQFARENKADERELLKIEKAINKETDFFTPSHISRHLSTLYEEILKSIPADDPQRPMRLVRNNLMYLATSLELQDFTDKFHKIECTRKAQSLRELARKDPPLTSLEQAESEKTLKELREEVDRKAKKTQSLEELIDQYKRGISYNRALIKFLEDKQKEWYERPDFHSNADILSGIEQEIKTFINMQEEEKDNLTKKLGQYLPQIEKSINQVTNFLSKSLADQLRAQLEKFKAILKKPYADHVAEYSIGSLQDLEQIFINSIISERRYREKEDYFVREPEASKPSSEDDSKKFLNKLRQATKIKTSESEQKKGLFLKRLEKLRNIINKLKDNNPLKNIITTKIDQLKKVTHPNSEVESYILASSFKIMADSLANNSHNSWSAELGKKRTALDSDKLKWQDVGFLSRNRNILPFLFISLLIIFSLIIIANIFILSILGAFFVATIFTMAVLGFAVSIFKLFANEEIFHQLIESINQKETELEDTEFEIQESVTQIKEDAANEKEDADDKVFEKLNNVGTTMEQDIKPVTTTEENIGEETKETSFRL